ncbi:MAG: hypothetical protein ACE5FI_13830, partial [Anaerolineales bacterium]
LPDEVREEMNFILVETMDEALRSALPGLKPPKTRKRTRRGAGKQPAGGKKPDVDVHTRGGNHHGDAKKVRA